MTKLHKLCMLFKGMRIVNRAALCVFTQIDIPC